MDEKDTAGQATPEESLEALSLVWPGYFADPGSAPPMPHVEFSQPASLGLWTDLTARMPALSQSAPAPFFRASFQLVLSRITLFRFGLACLNWVSRKPGPSLSCSAA